MVQDRHIRGEGSTYETPTEGSELGRKPEVGDESAFLHHFREAIGG